jgi:regulator of sirC expression with transglutaminase-like and TPR domain
LLRQAPHDPDASKLRRQVDEGRKQNPEIKALRVSLKADMKAKQWSDAQRHISNLLALVPKDPDAIKAQKELAKQRQ